MLLLQKKKNVCLCLEKINALLIVAQVPTLAVEDAFAQQKNKENKSMEENKYQTLLFIFLVLRFSTFDS